MVNEVNTAISYLLWIISSLYRNNNVVDKHVCVNAKLLTFHFHRAPFQLFYFPLHFKLFSKFLPISYFLNAFLLVKLKLYNKKCTPVLAQHALRQM